MLHRCVRILALTALFPILADDPGAASQTGAPAPDVSPAQLHKTLAEGKASALARTRLGFYGNLVVAQFGFDATYYGIDIKIDEVALQVSGAVTMRAKSTQAGFFQPTLNLLTELIVDSVHSNGSSIGWTHVGNFLYITLPTSYDEGEEFEVSVYYHGHPPEGGFQGFEFGSHSGVPMISTLSEPYFAQSWWPCKDTPSDKADSVDMAVTVNSAFYAVSNGLLRDSINNGDGTTTYVWHESYPITTYLVSLAITNYARFTHWYHYGSDSMPVRFYSYPERLATAQSAWPITVDQIGVLADLFGEYPFLNEKYGIAHFTWGGAMEHQTVSSHTSSSGGFNQYLIVHELAHQWWGDMITCRDWHHIWLNEGFASYAEALWAEHLGGSASYSSYMSAMQYWLGGRIYIDDTTDVWNIFDTRVYDKGAWVLHMLRGVVGDSAFFATLRAYYSHPNHQHKDAVTEDFRDIAESVWGQDLDWFFQDWIYGYYYPKYYCSFDNEARLDGKWNVYVHLRQVQLTNPQVFRMPVPLGLSDGINSQVITAWSDEREEDYAFVLDFAPTGLTVDPANWILNESYSEPYGLYILSDSLCTSLQYGQYRDSVVARCGDPGTAVTYAVTSGSLPPGLVLDAATGQISGMTTDTTDRQVTIRASATGYLDAYWTTLVAVQEAAYMPGDQNADRQIDIQDVVMIIDYAFRGALPPVPPQAADANGDCSADITDVVTIIDHAFRGGPLPVFGCLP